MAAPRIQAPDSGEGSTGNPILDSANALDVDSSATPITLEGNRPAQSSPLKSSMTAADLDSPVSREAPSSAAGGTLQSTSPSASGEQQHQQAGGVENVIAAIGGAAVTAPLAALEAISNKVPDLVNTVKAHVPHAGVSSGTPASGPSTAKIPSGETLLEQAQHLASQATQLAQQGVHQLVEKLPEGVTSHLPSQITSIGASPAEKEHAATGKQAYDFTETHTTGNFEASGSLQSTNNPAIVEAQSDLAVRAESGDI